MAFFSFLDPFMNFLLGWTLLLKPFWAILLISFILSLLVTLIYKFTTNQSLMKSLKEEIKALQAEMKMLRDNPSKMMEVNKRAMETNMKYMSQSFRPMLFTFIPVILIFGWVNAHWAFEPIHPGQEFTVNVLFEKGAAGNITLIAPDGITLTGDATRTITDGNAIFTMKAAQVGTFLVTLNANEKLHTKEVIVANERAYIEPVKKINDGFVSTITTLHNKTQVLFSLSWLWSYIIFSLVFSIVIRKLMKIY